MITVIIPTYCEEANINVMLEKVRATLENLSLPYEVLVIDDSSKDKTVAIAEDFFREFNCGKVIVRKKAPGLALSVIDGFKQSKGEIIIVMDADLSHPPESIPNLI